MINAAYLMWFICRTTVLDFLEFVSVRRIMNIMKATIFPQSHAGAAAASIVRGKRRSCPCLGLAGIPWSTSLPATFAHVRFNIDSMDIIQTFSPFRSPRWARSCELNNCFYTFYFNIRTSPQVKCWLRRINNRLTCIYYTHKSDKLLLLSLIHVS